MTAPSADPLGEGGSTATKAPRPWYLRWRFLIPTVLVALLLVAPLVGGFGKDAARQDEKVASDATSTPIPDPDEAENVEPEEPEEVDPPEMTPGQQSALAAAAKCLDSGPLSRAGLIRLLSSADGGGHSVEDAAFAADMVDVDWSEQAAIAAQDYLDRRTYSRQALIDQLSNEAADAFTVEQATYGVDQAGL